MQSKKIAIMITLAGLTIVLSPAFLGPAIPAPFLPLVSYHIYEIPIVVAFFLIGPKYGFIAALLNAIIMQLVFLDSSFIRPIPNLLAVSSTLLGIYFAQKLVRGTQQVAPPNEKKRVIFSTALGTLCRLAVMLPFNCALMLFGAAFAGFQMPPLPAILVYLGLLAVFDLTLMLYTIPTGFVIARTVIKNLKIAA
jgi:riboflavin transporter FmnP